MRAGTRVSGGSRGCGGGGGAQRRAGGGCAWGGGAPGKPVGVALRRRLRHRGFMGRDAKGRRVGGRVCGGVVWWGYAAGGGGEPGPQGHGDGVQRKTGDLPRGHPLGAPHLPVSRLGPGPPPAGLAFPPASWGPLERRKGRGGGAKGSFGPIPAARAASRVSGPVGVPDGRRLGAERGGETCGCRGGLWVQEGPAIGVPVTPGSGSVGHVGFPPCFWSQVQGDPRSGCGSFLTAPQPE